MVGKVKAVFTPAVRKWLYGVASAVSAALGVFGVLDAQKLAAILFVFSAVLLMANQNVDTPKKVAKRDA